MKTKFKIERLEVLVFSIFYAIAGVTETIILALSNFRLVTVGVIGVLSLLSSYGLMKMKKWAVSLVIALFFPEITFGITTLYFSLMMQRFFITEVVLFNLALIVYIIFCFVSFIYVAAKRETFQE